MKKNGDSVFWVMGLVIMLAATAVLALKFQSVFDFLSVFVSCLMAIIAGVIMLPPFHLKIKGFRTEDNHLFTVLLSGIILFCSFIVYLFFVDYSHNLANAKQNHEADIIAPTPSKPALTNNNQNPYAPKYKTTSTNYTVFSFDVACKITAINNNTLRCVEAGKHDYTFKLAYLDLDNKSADFNKTLNKLLLDKQVMVNFKDELYSKQGRAVTSAAVASSPASSPRNIDGTPSAYRTKLKQKKYAELFDDEGSINLALINKSVVSLDRNISLPPEYIQAEQKAMIDKKGVWSIEYLSAKSLEQARKHLANIPSDTSAIAKRYDDTGDIDKQTTSSLPKSADSRAAKNAQNATLVPESATVNETSANQPREGNTIHIN